jgi:hypothetical protein
MLRGMVRGRSIFLDRSDGNARMITKKFSDELEQWLGEYGVVLPGHDWQFGPKFPRQLAKQEWFSARKFRVDSGFWAGSFRLGSSTVLPGLRAVSDYPGFEQAADTPLYTLSPVGWQQLAKTPEREVLRCLRCYGLTTVTVGITEAVPEFRTNAKFIAWLRNEKNQKGFANVSMQNQAPSDRSIPFAFTIQNTRITKKGRDAFEMVAVIQTATKQVRSTIKVTVHRQKLVSVALNYYEGTFDEDAQREVNALFTSIKFQ